MADTDKVVHQDEELKVTLQTWRGGNGRLFQFESVEGLLLRVNFENDKFSVVCNQGTLQIVNQPSNPFAFTVSK